MKATLNSNVQSIIKDAREKIITSIKELISDLGGTLYIQDESLTIFNTMKTENGSLSQCRLKRLEIENNDSVVLVYSNHPDNPEREIKDFVSLLSIQELISLVDSIQLCLQYKHMNLFSTNITISIK